MCRDTEQELEQSQKREEELRKDLKRAEKWAEIYKEQAEFIDSRLQYTIDIMAENPARAREAVEEGFRNTEEIVCCSAMGCPTAMCSLCGEEESTLVVLPCNHLCLCSKCQSQADTCPDCHFMKTGWLSASMPN